MGTTSAGFPAQLSAGIAGVGFSLASPLIVPCLSRGVVSHMPLDQGLAAHRRFLELCTENCQPRPVSFMSRWGPATAETGNDASPLVKVTAQVVGHEGDDLTFVMEEVAGKSCPDGACEYGGDFCLKTELTYTSAEHGFRVTQFSQAPVNIEGGEVVAAAANGIAAIAVASGAALVDRACESSPIIPKDATWDEVMRSMLSSGEVVPLTVFHLASIFTREAFAGCDGPAQMFLKVYDHQRRQRGGPTPLVAGSSGALQEPAGGLSRLGRKFMEIISVGQGRGYEPHIGVMDGVPAISFYYLPAGEFSAVLDSPIERPVVEVVQNLTFRHGGGTGPFARVVGNLVLAAAAMRPDAFPLEDKSDHPLK